MTELKFVLTPAMVDAMLGVLILIAVDVLLGIVAAVRDGTFDFGKLPSFMRQSILPYVGSLIVLGAAATVHEAVQALYFAAAVAAGAKFLKDIKDKVAGVFGPLQSPEG